MKISKDYDHNHSGFLPCNIDSFKKQNMHYNFFSELIQGGRKDNC